MKILYQIPSLKTMYAARFIYEGYKNAFTDLGHDFKPLVSDDNIEEIFDSYNPDIFISSLNSYYLKYLDLKLIKKYRQKSGLVFFNQVSPWKKVNNQFGSGGLSSQKIKIRLIKEGLAGDIFFHWLEQDSPLMDGFTRETGYPFHTILLAADKRRFYYDFSKRYQSDVSYVGNFLPDKKIFMQKHLMPLFKKYKVRVYGNDWTSRDRFLGKIQKFGQYFNISFLSGTRKLQLSLNDERKVYSSSTISLNIHEDHQRKLGSDFNERTFKIIASGGFEICDNVKVLRKYFTEKELVIAENTVDWFDKIDYYLSHDYQREKIIKSGRKKVLKEHTYHNRANQFINLYKKFKREK